MIMVAAKTEGFVSTHRARCIATATGQDLRDPNANRTSMSVKQSPPRVKTEEAAITGLEVSPVPVRESTREVDVKLLKFANN